ALSIVPSVRHGVLQGHTMEGDPDLPNLCPGWRARVPPLPCPSPALGLGSWVRPLQVFQDYSGFFVYGTLVGFWLLLSSMHKRHLVINHVQGCYQIYIKRRLWEEGPLHQIYVRLTAQTDGTAPARGESPPLSPQDSRPSLAASVSSSMATGWRCWSWPTCRTSTSTWSSWAGGFGTRSCRCGEGQCPSKAWPPSLLAAVCTGGPCWSHPLWACGGAAPCSVSAGALPRP
uniref:Uncharacterized protein n=1 Tax=Gopherus agassizii TaxID=38772 RepID=A0A452I4T6_9SAUR